MSHIIGRGRYARETYPQAQRGGGAGCVLGVGADSNEKVISLVTSDDFFLFPRQQNVQGNPVEVVLPASFALGDALLIRYHIEWSYNSGAVTPPSVANVLTFAVVDLGSGFQGIFQALGISPYSGSFRVIKDDADAEESVLIAATAGSILFTPPAFTAPPRVAILCETDVPIDLSTPNVDVADDSGPAFLDVTHIKAGCVFQEPDFVLSDPFVPALVPFTPQQ